MRLIKCCSFIILTLCSFMVFSHGSMETPISRVYQCYKENPENPNSDACKAAVAEGGRQPLYNWNEVNQPAANSRHRDIIADGTLCAGGRDFYKGFNLARTDWISSVVEPDVNGQFNFVYNPTAPHSTKYFKLYVTKDTYDFTQPLKWSDLADQPFCTVTDVNLVNGRYNLPCNIPSNYNGKRIIFAVWQRDDSPEAFYSCSDVFINSAARPVEWKEVQTLFNSADIEVDTTVSFRLFKQQVEVDTHSIVVTDADNKADQWPLALAQKVNAESSLVKIGQLNPETGEVVLNPGDAVLKVYVRDQNTSQYHTAIDFMTPNSQVDFIYPDGISQYTDNTIVMGRHDLKRYRCKPWPFSGWCGGSQLYYEPGVGLAWDQAWELIG